MEKRERRNRSRRPRDPPNRNDPPPAKNAVGSAADNNDSKKAIEEKSDKKVIDHTAIPDPHMFDNLKRETEDIAALKRPVVGGKRQIFSNWAKYETPIHDDADGKIGEDFEALLQQGGQKGGHFRFKSERGWDPESVSLSSTILTLDLAALAEALTSIPLYERLGLPTDVFMAEEIERMDKQARERAAAFQVNQTKRTPQAKEEAEKVKVDLRADGDVQSLEFDMDDVRTQWGTTSVEDPGPPTQVVMPELQVRESPTHSEEGSTRRSLSVEASEPQEVPEHRTPSPVTKEHSPTPEPQSPVEAPKPEPPAARGGQESIKAEGGRRQGKRQKGKNRQSWASSDEGDAAKVEPQPSSEPAGPPSDPATALQQPSLPVIPKQPSPPPQPVVQPVVLPEETGKTNVLEGRKRRKGEKVAPNQTLKASEEPTEKDNATKALCAEPKGKGPTPEKELLKHPPKSTDAAAAPHPTIPKKMPAPVTEGKSGDDDQLDFLLSLRHPVKEEPIAFSAPSSTAVRAAIDEEEPVPAAVPKLVETKKEALEDWLDSMLDD